MDRPKLIYTIFILVFALIVAAGFLIPYLAFKNNMNNEYYLFSYTCHQKISRSLCLFSNGNSYWVGDCTPQLGQFINTPQDRRDIEVTNGSIIGYKMPYCARDIGLYGGVLIGALLYPLSRDLKEEQPFPQLFLILAMVPIGIDGTVQLISDLGWLGFVYESTNETRLITGLIAGVVSAFYALPILMSLFSATKPDQKKIIKVE